MGNFGEDLGKVNGGLDWHQGVYSPPLLTRVGFSGRKILTSRLGKYLGDSLPHEAKRLLHQGFRKKPTLVSLPLLPYSKNLRMKQPWGWGG